MSFGSDGAGPQVRLFLGLEVLARPALGAGVDVDAAIVAAPGDRVDAGRREIAADLATEAVLADARDAALDAGLGEGCRLQGMRNLRDQESP